MNESPESWTEAAGELVEHLARTARGPKRDGVFAVWLVLRVAEGLLGADPLPERGHRRRVAALERRLSSLTLPTPLRRALAAAIATLREGGATGAVETLTQLVAPVRETLGPSVAEAVARAARAARRQVAPAGGIPPYI